MPTDRKIRVLVAKPGLDGHDRGAKVIARALRDAGMEVIYTGLRQTPEMIVTASLQEDVDVIGLSILSGAHNAIVPRVMDLLKQNHMDDVLLVVGGIIPDQDVEGLKKAGVAAVFQPGTKKDTLIRFSTVAGERGSPDTWRDPCGSALKFYTSEGNYDIVWEQHSAFFRELSH